MASEATTPPRDHANALWACSADLDRWFLFMGGYVTAAVLVVSAFLGEVPWLTPKDIGPVLGIGLFVSIVIVTPHLVATWWVWLGNDALKTALASRTRRVGTVNAVFIAVVGVGSLIVAQTHWGCVGLLVAIGLVEAHHLTAQDRGFLSLYRWRRGASEGAADKENLLMRYASVWLLLNTLGSPNGAYWHDIQVTEIDWPWVPPVELFWISHLVLGVLAARVVIAELRRPEGAHKAKLLYVVSALGSYSILIVSPLLGYITARLHHSAGYLGLSLRLVRNLSAAGQFRDRLLPWASKHGWRYVLVLAVLSYPLTQMLGRGSNITGGSILIAFAALINGHHYFLDAIIWRFSRPEIREGVGQYI